MRALLALLVFGGTAIGREIALNLPCNNELDGLLAQDPEGNGSAFLQCVAVEGVNGIGFWERKFCPNNMVFDFVGQQCKEEERKFYRKDISNKFNIAILNNSCARGEQCIGGTVCDLETLRCLCPYGTQADLDTLSCITPGMPSQFSGFSGFKVDCIGCTTRRRQPVQNPSQYGSSAGSGHIDVGFLPNPGQPQSNSVPFNFNFNANNNLPPPPPQQNFAGSNNQHQSNGFTDFFQPNPITGNVDFKPNPFIIPPAPQTKKLPILAAPGKSCREGELCTGGSLCTRPLGLCLCPGDLEERQGECVLPERASIHINKVGIGAICGDLAECDHGSSCVNGRCMCVAPLVQENGRCIMQAQVKEVGPLPAVAPWGTPSPSYPTQTVPPSPLPSIPPQQPSPLPVQQAVSPPDQPYRPPVTYTTRAPFQPMPPVTQPPPQQPFVPRQPAPITEQPEQNRPAPQQPDFGTTQTFRAINTPAPPSIKHNLIKLGGSKQAGVGVRCSLNTDCMVGAYCNGNTNPPSCQCLSTHVNVEGRCEKVIYPGQIGCLTDSQCTAAYTGTRCIDRSCVCPQGQKAVDQTCVPDKSMSCKLAAECPLSLHCLHGKCVCLPTMVQHNSSCVFPANISCSSDSQCPKAMQCGKRAKCECPRNGTFVNGECVFRYRFANRSRRQSNSDSSMVCWPGSPTCAGRRGLCINDVCHCLEGYVQYNEHCVQEFLQEGQECAVDEENTCRPPLECINGVCECTSAIGCKVESSTFWDSPTKIACPEGTISKKGKCVNVPGAFVSLNAACFVQDRCSLGSLCLNGMCKCVHGAFERSGRCHQIPGGKCSNGEVCDGNSLCEFGLCKCLHGTTLKDGMCLPSAALPGSSCQLGQVCTGGSKCRFGICMCIGLTYASEGRCISKESVIPIVTKPKNMITTSAPVPSNSHTPLRFSHRKDKDSERFPGDACEIGRHRCSNGSVCVDGLCSCIGGEVLEDGACVPMQLPVIEEPQRVTLNERCDEHTACLPEYICKNGTCSCQESQKLENNTCVDFPAPAELKGVTPGMLCTLTIECPFRTECKNSVCRCKHGETIVDNSCREAINQVLPGGQCDSKRGYDCIGESQCRFGVCTCGLGLISNGKECVTLASLAEVLPEHPCNESTICIGGSFCFQGICTCSPDYVVDVNKKCVSKTSVYPVYHKLSGIENAANQHLDLIHSASPGTTGQEVTHRFEYLPTLGEYCEGVCRDGAACIRMLCQCSNDFFPFNGKCVHRSEADIFFKTQSHLLHQTNNTSVFPMNPHLGINLEGVPNILFGHKCRGPTDCPANAFCFGTVCRCLYGFRATSGFCETVIPLGGKCASANQCENDASCVNGVCACSKSDGKRCKSPKLARPGDECLNNQICSFNSYCSSISGVCECPPGMETSDDRCLQTESPPGSYCLSSRNCHKFSYCDNGNCICKNDYILNKGYCVPIPGKISNEDFLQLVKQTYTNGFNTYPPYSNSNEQNIANLDLIQAKIREELEQGTSEFESDESNYNKEMNSFRPSSFPLPTMPPIVQTTTIPLPYIAVNVPARHKIPPFSFTARGFERSGNPVQINVHPTVTSYEEPVPNMPNTYFAMNPNVMGEYRAAGVPTTNGDANPAAAIVLKRYETDLAQPGEYCGQYIQCAGNAYCEHDFCRCARGSKPVNGYCTKRKHRLPNSKTDAEFGGEDLDNIRQFASPLEACENGEFCTGGSECIKAQNIGRLCQCPENRAVLDAECVEIPKTVGVAGIGASCAMGELCLGGSKCKAKLCVCADGTDELYGICVRKALAGESCAAGEICSDGSMCNRNHCVCPIGSVPFKSRCVIVKQAFGVPGTACADDLACSADAYCSDKGICECPPFHVSYNSRCVRTELLKMPNQMCDMTSICSNGTVCDAGYCLCPDNTQWTGESCERMRDIRFKRQTNLQRLECDDDECTANEVVTSPPGGSCSGERECTGGSICREGWCVCPHPTMIVQKGICVQTQPRPTLPPRPAPTSIRTQPPTPIRTQPPTQAAPVYATAPPPARPHLNVGRKAVPGSQCGPLDTCVGGSMCVEGYCLCPAGSRASELGRCVPDSATATQPSAPAPAAAFGGGRARVLRPLPTSSTSPPPPPPSQPPPPSPQPTSPPRRPTAASIEVPLTPSASNLVPQQPPPADVDAAGFDDAECRAVGLICKGNTVCRNRSCQCPDGHVLLGDACVLPGLDKKAARRGKSWSQANSAKYARPLTDCSNGEVCTGGSNCAQLPDGSTRCTCPPERPTVRGDHCVEAPARKIAFPGGACDENTACARGSVCQSGICQCHSGQIAIAGMCTTPPPPTASPVVTLKKANPFESCEDGETCVGGSSCDEDTGRCMCPVGMIVMLGECKVPPTTPKTPVAKSAGCQSDVECGGQRICVVGACKCKPGFVDSAGTCEPLEAVEFNERPAPVSYARHKVQSLAADEDGSAERTTAKPKPRRITGPPIRRPRPKTKITSSSSGGGSSGSNLKTGSGDGTCPPGNEPTRDESSGRIIMCNGLEPNCPPRSYCYITSGGFATEEYNCCKSW